MIINQGGRLLKYKYYKFFRKSVTFFWRMLWEIINHAMHRALCILNIKSQIISRDTNWVWQTAPFATVFSDSPFHIVILWGEQVLASKPHSTAAFQTKQIKLVGWKPQMGHLMLFIILISLLEELSKITSSCWWLYGFRDWDCLKLYFII